ncbi:DUF7948 domain-containing protein [Halobacillus sp. K22]|uniref:DUF7948 domain-containing protein n=1 Tax=Halobacillus sp. K22 TaxID=3457431 RepID=UPI003FCE48D2
MSKSNEDKSNNDLDDFGKLSSYFVPNIGQHKDEQILYEMKGLKQKVLFTSEGVIFTIYNLPPEHMQKTNKRVDYLSGKEKQMKVTGVRLDFHFIGANLEVKPEGRLQGNGKVNYFRGHQPDKWQRNIPVFQEVAYRDLWPGIDLIFKGENGQIKYEFLIQPGARVEDICFSYEGPEGIELDNNGNLLIHTVHGTLIDQKPVSFQKIRDDKCAVETNFNLKNEAPGYGIIRFSVVDDYNKTIPLTIDPGLVYSSYIGGSSYDEGRGIALDGSGNIYITGVTNSDDFPATVGAFESTYSLNGDVFVTKLNPEGTDLIYSTYLGGSAFEFGMDIAADEDGSAYVTGITRSDDFPVTGGAYDQTFSGSSDGFVTKLAPDGNALVYSTYLGGSDDDSGEGIAVDAEGNAYVTGFTDSDNFPVTMAGFDPDYNGGGDAFITKLNPDGSELIYSTYIGGSAFDAGLSIALDPDTNAYITGYTASESFPTTEGAYDREYNGGIFDAFVAKLNPDGTELIYSTYIGGSEVDQALALAVDASGHAYITGNTNSENFPTTAGAYDTNYNGGTDLFATKLNPDGTELVYSTYLGGTVFDGGYGIAVDASGNSYITGATQSTDFPTTANAVSTILNGDQDVFVTKLNSTGTDIVYSTYLGGSSFEGGLSIVTDSKGHAFVTGFVDSDDFPTTAGAYNTLYNGSGDTYVTKINTLSAPGIICPDDIRVTSDPGIRGAIVNFDSPTVIEDCPLGFSVTCDPPSGTLFPIGNTVVTCTVTDPCDRLEECYFTVNVSDREKSSLLLDLKISQEVQVVYDMTLEVEARLRSFPTHSNSPPSFQIENELLCINAQKVYDWVAYTRDIQREVPFLTDCDNAIKECLDNGESISIQCEALPNSSRCSVLGGVRGITGLSGASWVPLRFTTEIQVQAFCENILVCKFEFPICWVEELVLCYPKGTSILTKRTEVQCIVQQILT